MALEWQNTQIIFLFVQLENKELSNKYQMFSAW